jgi:hypothetical protein
LRKTLVNAPAKRGRVGGVRRRAQSVNVSRGHALGEQQTLECPGCIVENRLRIVSGCEDDLPTPRIGSSRREEKQQGADAGHQPDDCHNNYLSPRIGPIIGQPSIATACRTLQPGAVREKRGSKPPSSSIRMSTRLCIAQRPAATACRAGSATPLPDRSPGTTSPNPLSCVGSLQALGGERRIERGEVEVVAQARQRDLLRPRDQSVSPEAISAADRSASKGATIDSE